MDPDLRRILAQRRTIVLEIEFEDELEDPVATVTELGRRIRDEEIALNLRSTKVRPMVVRGSIGEYSFSMLQEERPVRRV